MPVTRNRVGLEVVRRLREKGCHLGLAPGARNPRLGIRDEMVGVDQSAFDKRHEAELDGGRIAARVGYQARIADRRPVHFRQSVNRLADPLRARVLHPVPAAPVGDVADAIIGREIDDAHASVEQRRRLLHRHSVRGGEEDEVAAVEVGAGWILETKAYSPAQVGEHLRDLGAGIAARRDAGNLDFRVPRQQAQQFDAGITGATDDADSDHPGLRDSME
ncbi:MAG: hypothetical protein AW07_03308 [Candidatus Accumulibacter sp. SK-11]|nr:MAG: hypothetical protein AW07_03308 [Candidatus Accumulibacter sp. SK-11]